MRTWVAYQSVPQPRPRPPLAGADHLVGRRTRPGRRRTAVVAVVVAGLVGLYVAGATIFNPIVESVAQALSPDQDAAGSSDHGAAQGKPPAAVGEPNKADTHKASGLGDGPITKPGPSGQVHPQLMARFNAAKAAAKKDGLQLEITSGWRSVEEQQDILQQRIKELGSREAAEKLVAPPETSAHTKGLAIDVGPPEGAAWLEEHGAQFGLCRMYGNEAWHFEPVIAPGGTCPALQPDAAGLWD